MNNVSVKALIEKKGRAVIVPHGYSMWPIIRNLTDCVLIEKTCGRLKKYDIAVYASGEKQLMHRVIKVNEHDYVIQGDNCRYKEYGITDSDIFGIVSGYYKGDKFISCKNKRYKFISRLWVAVHPVYIVLRRADEIAEGILVKLKIKKKYRKRNH